jgi:predicted metal-dependent HD superfamily phosphohydrolase
VSEIKPAAMLRDYDVQAKASAAKAYIKEYYKDHKIEYKFITETMIFADNTEYLEFLKQATVQI